MAVGIHSIEVKKMRGTLTVIAVGKTQRGTRYIKRALPMKASTMHSKEYKAELAMCVAEILG